MQLFEKERIGRLSVKTHVPATPVSTTVGPARAAGQTPGAAFGGRDRRHLRADQGMAPMIQAKHSLLVWLSAVGVTVSYRFSYGLFVLRYT